ncbi:MAG: MFS transporter [Acidimicrobiia bacterium]
MRAPTGFDRATLLIASGIQTVGLATVLALLADLQDAYGFATWGLGLIGGIAFATSFLAYVGLSRFADQGHAKKMLIIGAVVGVVGLVWAAFGTTLWSLALARALFGLAEGTFVPAARRIMIDWRPDNPGTEIGRLISVSVTGFVVGPLVGALLAEQFGLAVPFLVPAAVIAILLPFLFRVVPAPIPPGEVKAPVRALAGNKALWAAILLGSCELFAIGAFDAVWARLMSDMGASTWLIGVSFAAFVIPIALLSSVWGALADRSSPMRVGMVATALSIPFLGTYGLWQTPEQLIWISVLHGAVTAGIQPAAAAAVTRLASGPLLATGQGMLQAVGFAAAALVALPSGWLYQRMGPEGLFPLVAAGVAVLLITSGLLWRAGGAGLPR